MKRMPPPLLIATLLALLAGCAGQQPSAPDNIGYHQLRESFGDRDLTPLQGRRILIDPGHGGHFPGVVGLNGITEAEVNLGVALWLRGLLEAAGAEVHMTRTADTDFLSPADSTLATDLATRSAICDSLQPDVFLSIHHNSNAQLDRDLNETQTYYPVGREGADLDLARAIHKHLVRNLEIEPAKIMAGNFSVLRNATVPAVLGEPSMLSNPGVEEKLSEAGKQRLEAEAYFLGLLEYFEGGNPYWVAEYDSTKARDVPQRWRFVKDRFRPEMAPALDPTSITLYRNGEPYDYELDLETSTITFKRRYDSRYTLRARNLAGRSTPTCMYSRAKTEMPFDYRIGIAQWNGQRSAGFIHWIDNRPERGPIYLCDEYSETGRVLLNESGLAEGVNLVPAALFPEKPFIQFINPERSGHDTMISSSHSVSKYADSFSWCVLSAPDGTHTIPEGEYKIRALPGCDIWPEKPMDWIRHRPVFPLFPDNPAWLEIRGTRPILIDATHRTPWQEPCDLPRDTLVWQPLVPELVGKTIVIDPHGGAADADGTAPMGTPGRELNLRVAERLAGLLRGAGAEALLTRNDPGWVPPEAKVLQANESDADLFITLRRAASESADWSIAHHYGSAGGSAWGALLAEALAPLAAPDSIPVTESYAYLLRHTACPAVDVSLPMPADLDAEELWRAPAYQQAVASALMSATAAWFEGPDLLRSLADPRTFILENTMAPTLVEGCDWIRVDGNWLWLPPRDDAAPAALLPLPGTDHTFEVRRGDRWELLVSGIGEGDRTRVWPFWTSERRPTNPFAETDDTHEAASP